MTDHFYLSRARLRTGRGEALSAIAPILMPDDKSKSAGFAHRLVWLLFQDIPDASRDFLWRDDGDGRTLIFSRRPPVDPNGLFELDSKPFAPDLSPGNELRFSLRANPTIARKGALAPEDRARRARGKRVDVVMDALSSLPKSDRAMQRDRIIAETGRTWLDEQGCRAGFSIQSLAVTSYAQVDIGDHERKKRRDRAGISVMDLVGVLVVTDPPVFVARLKNGFGSAKAFGCGLMLIRRA